MRFAIACAPSRLNASGAVLEAPGFIAGLDDVAVMGEPVQQRGGHLGVAEDARPFGEAQVSGDDDAAALVGAWRAGGRAATHRPD